MKLTQEQITWLSAGDPIWQKFCEASMHPDVTTKTKEYLDRIITERMAQRGAHEKVDVQSLWETKKLTRPVYVVSRDDKYHASKYQKIDMDTLDRTAIEIRTVDNKATQRFRRS